EATARPRFSDQREQKRDSSDTRKSIRDNKRRQEFLRPHQLWSGEPLGIFTTKDVNGLFFFFIIKKKNQIFIKQQ
ncbi:unnamed protein product, partial [Rotaria sp. Silwood1]